MIEDLLKQHDKQYDEFIATLGRRDPGARKLMLTGSKDRDNVRS